MRLANKNSSDHRRNSGIGLATARVFVAESVDGGTIGAP